MLMSFCSATGLRLLATSRTKLARANGADLSSTLPASMIERSKRSLMSLARRSLLARISERYSRCLSLRLAGDAVKHIGRQTHDRGKRCLEFMRDIG